MVLLAGCSDDPVPEHSVASPAAVRQHQPGSDVTVTAVVTEVRSDRAFVLADADLPLAVQLVVVSTPVTAVGGMVVPALAYVVVNAGAAHGWLAGSAVPTATDIAFALAVLDMT